MCDKQLDLFTFRANHHERLSPEAPRNPPIAAPTLDDPALIAAIPAAGLADALALAAEAGSRKLASAVPALEAYVTASRVSAPTVLFQNKLRLCRRLRPSAARERPKRLLGC